MKRFLPVLILMSLFSFGVLNPMDASADVSMSVSVNIGPPPLPYYPQPFCPGPGYIWTPGYWAYGPYGYVWVPGTWVLAPAVGLLWTPGYWGWRAGYWWWHPGYWGPHVGFYGGIAYGYGYFGQGFTGGYWRGNNYYYNRSVTQVNVTYIHNTYEEEAPAGSRSERVSYNGGAGGVAATPTAEEQRYASEQHLAPTSEQAQHERAAMDNLGQRYSNNHGHPEVAGTVRPARFNGDGVARSDDARNSHDYHPSPRNMGAARPPREMQHMRAPREDRRHGAGGPPARKWRR